MLYYSDPLSDTVQTESTVLDIKCSDSKLCCCWEVDPKLQGDMTHTELQNKTEILLSWLAFL